MASLAEQTKQLASPKPTNFDPEEDDFDTTRAKLVNKDNEDDSDGKTFGSSALRKKNALFLSDEDQKYHGRRVSRSDMAKMRGDFVESDESGDNLDEQDHSDEDSEDDQDIGNQFDNDDDDNEDHDDDGGSDDEDDDGGGSDDDNDDGVSDDEDDDDDGSDDEDDDDDGSDDEDDDEGGDMLSSQLLDDKEQDKGISSFSASKMEEEIEKGNAVKHQLSLWDTFLEYRIRLQKGLVLANKLPQCDSVETFKASSIGQPEAQQGKKVLSDLLYNLLVIQEKLLDQNPETRKTLYPSATNGIKKDSHNNNDDEEEIPSDSENEEKGDSDDDDNKVETNGSGLKLQPLKRKACFTSDEFSECITKRHASFQAVQDSIISKWSEKTKLASGKLNSKSFSAFDRSALTQIKQVLSDKPRLIKRSQLKRSSYRVLGKKEKEKPEDVETEREANAHLKDYDTEIFDDDDFYHQLLREFIERQTTSNSDDPIEMGRKWLELQKLRRKIKKKVDTKASKGRKLRYNVLNKLTSYMPPIERGSMPDSSRNELFMSLFGQSKAQSEIVDIDLFR